MSTNVVLVLFVGVLVVQIFHPLRLCRFLADRPIVFSGRAYGNNQPGRSAAAAAMSHLSQIAAMCSPAAAESTPLSSYGDSDGGGSHQRNSAGGPM